MDEEEKEEKEEKEEEEVAKKVHYWGGNYGFHGLIPTIPL